MTRLLPGTASWTDKPLIEGGRFYPADAKSAEARLRYYATEFPLVEVDAPYYGLPTVAQAERWVERTPAAFTFDVKAYSLFTEHPTPVARLPKVIQAELPPDLRLKRQFYRRDAPDDLVDLCWSTYLDALLPLHDAGKLGVIVLQFPRWVTPNRRSHAYLEEVRERLGHYRGAVEFRNHRWLDAENRESTLDLLGDLELTFICVDEPQGFDSSVPPIAAATTDLAFVRFHGRNAAMWEERTRTSSERFDYWYEATELDEWTPRIRSLAEEASEVHLVVNTNNFDQGPVNARLLAERLSEVGLDTEPGFDPAPIEPPAPTGQGRLL
ncbi:MAG: DUF72 domain-containing protein [Chloroflexi bacterium]|nr:DUF72 domain-containing protein [Chloroflexota bacterium]